MRAYAEKNRPIAFLAEVKGSDCYGNEIPFPVKSVMNTSSLSATSLM